MVDASGVLLACEAGSGLLCGTCNSDTCATLLSAASRSGAGVDASGLLLAHGSGLLCGIEAPDVVEASVLFGIAVADALCWQSTFTCCSASGMGCPDGGGGASGLLPACCKELLAGAVAGWVFAAARLLCACCTDAVASAGCCCKSAGCGFRIGASGAAGCPSLLVCAAFAMPHVSCLLLQLEVFSLVPWNSTWSNYQAHPKGICRISRIKPSFPDSPQHLKPRARQTSHPHRKAGFPSHPCLGWVVSTIP